MFTAISIFFSNLDLKKSLKLVGAIVATILLVLFLYWVYSSIKESGRKEADAAWVEKYNASIKEKNKKIEELQLSFDKEAEEARAEVQAKDTKLDELQTRLESASKGIAVPRKCETVTTTNAGSSPVVLTIMTMKLTDRVPALFSETWNNMNATTVRELQK